MAVQIPQLPNFTIQLPQAPDLLGMALKAGTLREMNLQQQQQQQLLPLNVQEKQQQVQAANLENQQRQAQLASQQALIAAYSDPQVAQALNGAVSGNGVDPNVIVSTLIQKGVQPAQAQQFAAGQVERFKNYQAATKDQLENLDKAHGQLFDLLEGVSNSKPEAQLGQLNALKAKFAANPNYIPGLHPEDVGLIQNLDPAHLQAAMTHLGFDQKMTAAVKAQAEARDVAPFPPQKLADLNNLLALRYQASNPGKALPASYALQPGDSPKDYDRVDRTLTQTEQAAATAAQRATANALAQQGADLRNAEFNQREAIRNQDPVVAFDPKTNQRVFTTRGDAAANGLVGAGKALSEAEVSKEEAATRQFNDVQMNVSRYKVAYANLKGPLSATDVNNMTLIQSLTQQLEKPGEGGFVGSLSAGYVPALANSAQRQSLAKAWGSLSPDARELLTGYLRAQGSIPAYQRALTGTGRTSQAAMQIELANLPPPTSGYTAASPQLKAFQENIDVASQGLVKFPWLEGPKDIQGRIESQIRTPEAVKPQGQYRGGRNVIPGGQVIVDNKLRTVSQVYSDGTYDVR